MRIAYLLFLAAVLCGCSISLFNSSSERKHAVAHRPGISVVKGFGEGENSVQARRAAWDDAIARVRAMGIEHFNARTRGESSGSGYRNNVRYATAEVTLEIEPLRAPPIRVEAAVHPRLDEQPQP